VTVNNARYHSFTLHAGFIYYTSDTPPYVHLLGPRNGSSGRLYVLVVMIFLIFFISPLDLRAPSADRRETLPRDQYLRRLDNET